MFINPVFFDTLIVFFCLMFWILLIADLYYLSVGVRSIVEYGADTCNVFMVVSFFFLGVFIGCNLYLNRRRR